MIVLIAPIILGAAASWLLSRQAAQRDLQQQNQYNAPVEQVARLRAAGLPLAAMFGGGVSQQSEQPRATQVDPTLGVSDQIQKGMLMQFQQKQMELIEQQLETEKAKTKQTWADALNSFTNAQRNNSIFQFEMQDEGQFDTVLGGTQRPTNLAQGMVRERKMKEADLIAKDIHNKVGAIDQAVKEELHREGRLSERLRQDLRRVIVGNERIQQLINIGKLDERRIDALLDAIESSPDGFSTLDALILKLIM